ncbi:MAG: ornithine-acyl-ACP acyltransferase [Roseobacter sp. MedPE-SW]|nr:MAG: ornithine-acyl-ACP acyltransferase [Roseobacter sp. MedPE-SW]
MPGNSEGDIPVQAEVPGLLLEKGGYRARLAQGADDLTAAHLLRARCFRTASLDQDQFDEACLHVLIESRSDGALVGCFRLMLLENGQHLHLSYSSQFYDLTQLCAFSGRMMELGRFCIDPAVQNADVLRLAWGAVTGLVDQNGVGLLFGCSSFTGTNPSAFIEAFALLKRRHLAPEAWSPGRKAADTRLFGDLLQDRAVDQKPDLKLAQAQLPPLLRSYLTMGGWVSDHVVIDVELNTCHVFTGLEVKAVPRVRKRLLRGVAGSL